MASSGGDKGGLSEEQAQRCAVYILGWLEARNGGQLADALDQQTVGDRRRMRNELIEILRFAGKPMHWDGPPERPER